MCPLKIENSYYYLEVGYAHDAMKIRISTRSVLMMDTTDVGNVERSLFMSITFCYTTKGSIPSFRILLVFVFFVNHSPKHA